MDSSFNDLTPEEQAAVRTIAQRMGIEVPAGIIGNTVVDAQGNPIAKSSDLNQWRGMVNGLVGGTLTPDQILSTGSVRIAPQAPPTGLTGAEQAIQAGTTSALSTLGQGAETARNDLTAANNTAQQQIASGKDEIAHAALRANDIAQGQIRQGMDHVAHAAYTTNDIAQNLLGGGRQDILNTMAFTNAAGAQPLQGFNTAGQFANAQQAALSGAFGNEAQQKAFEDFNASPGQQFLRDQQEQALLRNNAAIGGLGGGNVRQALQEQAVGNAAQDFGNYYARLGEVANRGAQAGQGISSLLGGVGNNAINQLGGFATQGAGIAGNLGGNVVNSFSGLTGQGVGVTGNLGNNVLNQFGSANNLGANLTANTGQNMANVAQNTGLNAANLLGGAGNNLANYRYDTGVNLANTLSAGSGQLATLNQNQGISQADLLGQYTTGLANLLSGTGLQMASGDQALAALIANIATGAGSQYAGLPGIPGTQAAPNNVVSDAGLITQALGGMIPNNNGASSGGGNQLYGYTGLPNVANLA